jgi:23S rRNA (pseudouridine1915-N3)-methyltransferase
VRFVIAAVGKPRAAQVAAAIADYEARAARYWPLEQREVREVTGRTNTPDMVRAREGQQILDRIGGMQLVLCDRDGTRRTSEEFARWMQETQERSQDVAFVIGGAFGVSDAVRSSAWARLSLGPWTLPHELARLVLAEQLYRAGTIVRGEPYHK